MKYPRNARRDQLEEVELKIARRADQLAASSPSRPASHLHWWTEAEREIFGSSLSLAAIGPGGEATLQFSDAC